MPFNDGLRAYYITAASLEISPVLETTHRAGIAIAEDKRVCVDAALAQTALVRHVHGAGIAVSEDARFRLNAAGDVAVTFDSHGSGIAVSARGRLTLRQIPVSLADVILPAKFTLTALAFPFPVTFRDRAEIPALSLTILPFMLTDTVPATADSAPATGLGDNSNGTRENVAGMIEGDGFAVGIPQVHACAEGADGEAAGIADDIDRARSLRSAQRIPSPASTETTMSCVRLLTPRVVPGTGLKSTPCIDATGLIAAAGDDVDRADDAHVGTGSGGARRGDAQRARRNSAEQHGAPAGQRHRRDKQQRRCGDRAQCSLRRAASMMSPCVRQPCIASSKPFPMSSRIPSRSIGICRLRRVNRPDDIRGKASGVAPETQREPMDMDHAPVIVDAVSVRRRQRRHGFGCPQPARWTGRADGIQPCTAFSPVATRPVRDAARPSRA